MSTLTWASHNIHSVGQSPEEMRRNLLCLVDEVEAELNAGLDVLALQEAKRFDGTLPGFRRIAKDEGHDEHSNNVLLVRRGLEVTRTFFVEPGGPDWIGPKHGDRHPPRVFPGVRLRKDRQPWAVLDVHGIPNRSRNPVAAGAEWAALTEWYNGRRRGLPVLGLGDWNGRRTDISMLRFARRTKSRLYLKGIDGAVARDCRVKGLVELDGLFGSDAHQPVAGVAIAG